MLTFFRIDGSVDFVLLDFVMPGMDGREVRDALGCDLVLDGILIVLFSAMVERADMPGLAGYLYKPFEFHHLLAMVARVSRLAPLRISDASCAFAGDLRPALACRRRHRTASLLAVFDVTVDSATALLGVLQDAPASIQAACPSYLPSFEDLVVDLMVWAEQAERVMEAPPVLDAALLRRLGLAAKKAPQ